MKIKLRRSFIIFSLVVTGLATLALTLKFAFADDNMPNPLHENMSINLNINKELPLNWTQEQLEAALDKYDQEAAKMSNPERFEAIIDIINQLNESYNDAYGGLEEIVAYVPREQDFVGEITAMEKWIVNEGKKKEDIYLFFSQRVSQNEFIPWKKWKIVFSKKITNFLMPESEWFAIMMTITQAGYFRAATSYSYGKIYILLKNLADNNAFKEKLSKRFTTVLEIVYASLFITLDEKDMNSIEEYGESEFKNYLETVKKIFRIYGNVPANFLNESFLKKIADVAAKKANFKRLFVCPFVIYTEIPPASEE